MTPPKRAGRRDADPFIAGEMDVARDEILRAVLERFDTFEEQQRSRDESYGQRYDALTTTLRVLADRQGELAHNQSKLADHQRVANSKLSQASADVQGLTLIGEQTAGAVRDLATIVQGHGVEITVLKLARAEQAGQQKAIASLTGPAVSFVKSAWKPALWLVGVVVTLGTAAWSWTHGP